MRMCKESFTSKDGITLKEHFCSKLSELEKKIELQFKLNQIAIDKAELASNLRLEGMNEFRSAMKDQTVTFLTKEEYELRHQNLVEKIDAVQRILYIAMGVVLAVEFIFEYIFKIIVK